MNLLKEHFERCLNATYEERENGASVACEREGDCLYLLFQHSKGTTDWLNNLNFHAVPYKSMNPVWQRHGGFLKAWSGAEPFVEETLERSVREGIREVCVIGYSHGAALAVLCHEWVWYRYPAFRARLSGFGFGCPRVLYGCATAELALRWERFFTVRNLDDAVTHLPPKAMGFCHVGNLVEIGKLGKYSAIDAHRPESYLKELSDLS